MQRHAYRRLLLSAITLFSLASCNLGNQNATHDPVTLINAQRDYEGLIQLVKEQYPEINIKIEAYRGRNMSAYCKQQLETGSMPDIYSTTQAWEASYQEKNLLDLSGYKVSSLYNTARLGEYAIEGKNYLLPFDYTVTGIAYNKTLFEDKGISVPTSFTELKEVTIPALNEKGINTSVCLLNLPGSAFNYFFNVSGALYMNTKSGREWRSGFSDVKSDTFASDNASVKECASYFQEWIDCGMIQYTEGVSDSQTKVEEEFQKGNTAFMLGTIQRYTQNDDGSGDKYSLMPWLSRDGKSNIYITSPTRLYGLNKELGKSENKQKLEDALHVLEVLSTNEGYKAINGTTSSNLCSINGFEAPTTSSYYENAVDAVSHGKAMDIVYTGWDDYLAPYGNDLLSWVKGEEGKNATSSLSYLDGLKRNLKDNGKKVYATVTEELDTVQAAQLTGQIFMDKISESEGALVSYNVYDSSIKANLENSYGANGRILKGDMTEEYITVWLATGWYEKIQTVHFKGSKLKEMAKQGTDTRNTGFYYPYVFMTKDGKELEDDREYTFVLVGHNRKERETMGLIDTGIVGLDAAKEYLDGKTISSKSLNNDLVLSTTKSA